MSNLVCRLCLSTKFLKDLYKLDGDISLAIKTTSCVDVSIYPEDGLPSLICKKCKKKIKMFYQFKQNCIKVDLQLRNMVNSMALEDYNASNKHDSKCDSDEDFLCVFMGNNAISTEDDTLIKDFNDTCDIAEQLANNIDENFYFKPHEGTDEQFNISDTFIEETEINDKKALENCKDIDPEILQCEFCGCMLKTRVALKKHLSYHRRNKLFQCKLCPKRFTRAESMRIHMRSHMGIRPFVCELCGKSSTKRQDLIRHMKVHSDERKHACPTCGRRFKRSSDVCTHLRTHYGAKPYRCQLCDKAYTSHGGLRKHKKTHCKNNINDIVEPA